MSISLLLGPHRIRFAGKTDIGQVRRHNEDNLLLPREQPIAVVSDGMGGHASGEVASRLAVEAIDEHYRRTADAHAPTWPLRLPQTLLERDRIATAVKLANVRIYETGSKDPSKKGMGCTVDAIYFDRGRCYIGHVGDSRVYRIRDGRMVQLTEDHSLLNDWRRMKAMTGQEEADFPHKNVVVRALGLAEVVYVDTLVDDYLLGDVYLLCSDGLSGMLDDAAILRIATGTENLDAACSQLVAAANQAGGNDNITALLARVEAA